MTNKKEKAKKIYDANLQGQIEPKVISYPNQDNLFQHWSVHFKQNQFLPRFFFLFEAKNLDTFNLHFLYMYMYLHSSPYHSYFPKSQFEICFFFSFQIWLLTVLYLSVEPEN